MESLDLAGFPGVELMFGVVILLFGFVVWGSC